MRNLILGALRIGAAVGFLSACGAGAGNGTVPVTADALAAKHSQTFHFTGNRQSFVVPPNLKQITIVAVGATGAGPTPTLPGRVYAIVPVRSGDKLWVYVGGAGSGINGGFNGGANGGGGYDASCRCAGYGGGGASDIRLTGDGLHDRIIVAGGGGGAGGSWNSSFGVGGSGGKGGGNVADAGCDGRDFGTNSKCNGGAPCAGSGGGGGTQTSGGSGGAAGGCSRTFAGFSGALFSGGDGGSSYVGYGGPGGGGGGGGFFGGGGGGAGSYYISNLGGAGGAGGGSSFIERRAIASHSWKGWRLNTSAGLVVFDW
jgi:hypothetical protein